MSRKSTVETASAPLAAKTAASEKIPTPLLIGFIAMVFGMFMALLDIQIVASSLNEIQAGLAASPDEVSWVQTAYMIAEIVMIPLSSYLVRAFSTRVVFTISAASFTIASMLCATATDINTMLIYRAMQGFLGGAMIPTVFSVAFSAFPRDKQATLSVLIGLIATLAPTIGPTIGGYITELASWHWLFLINIVPGTIVTILVATFVRVDQGDPSLLKSFDALGLIFMALFLGSLEYVVDKGPRNDWFSDRTITDFSVVLAVSSVLFFWRVLTIKNPIINLRVFKNRNFTTGCLFTFVLGIALYGLIYLLPLYLGRVRGFNSLQIGETLLVTGICQFLSAPLVGRLSRTIDPRILLALGFVLLAVSTYQMAEITADWQFNQLFWPQVTRGLGVMCVIVPANSVALGTLLPHEIKDGSSLFNLMRNTGGAIGLAGIDTMIERRSQFHWNRLSETVNAGHFQVEHYLKVVGHHYTSVLGGTNGDTGALKILAQMVNAQATVMSYADTFLVMAIIFGLTSLSMIFVQKSKSATKAGGGGH